MTPLVLFLAAVFGAALGTVFGAAVGGLFRLAAEIYPATALVWRGAHWFAAWVTAIAAGASLLIFEPSPVGGNDLAWRGATVIAMFAALAVLMVSAARWSRPARPRTPPSFASPSGALGLIAIALAAAGLIGRAAGMHGGTSIAVVAIFTCVILIAIDLARKQRRFDRVRARMTEVQHWPLPRPGDRIDPYETNRVTGRWSNARIGVALVQTGAVLRVTLDRWPADLSATPADRRSTPTGDSIPTGDPTFDSHVRLGGDQALWRPLLTVDVRRLLGSLVGDRRGAVDAGSRSLEVALPGSQSQALTSILDQMAELAAALPDRVGPEALFDRLRAEPDAEVRRGHYTWLLGRNWNPPQVLRAAAADPDPDLAAWARARLPPGSGAYR